jgi:hypothetical protein
MLIDIGDGTFVELMEGNYQNPLRHHGLVSIHDDAPTYPTWRFDEDGYLLPEKFPNIDYEWVCAPHAYAESRGVDLRCVLCSDAGFGDLCADHVALLRGST